MVIVTIYKKYIAYKKYFTIKFCNYLVRFLADASIYNLVLVASTVNSDIDILGKAGNVCSRDAFSDLLFHFLRH